LRSHFNNWNSRNSSRGVSPLLGIVLIIGMTIMLSVLVYEFTFGYSEGTIKHVEKEIENAQPVNFDIREAKTIDYRQLKLLVESKDKKIISIFKGRVYGNRGAQTFTLEGVQPFETRLLSTNYNYLEVGEITKIELIPTTEKVGISNVHPISLETTIKVTSEISQVCQSDINLNGIPDCVDDNDNDGCSNDIDYDINIACNLNSCDTSGINGCDNTCKPVVCSSQEICSGGICITENVLEDKCRLLNAYWSEKEVKDEEYVRIVIEGDNCEGTVKLEYSEIDTFSPDDDINDTEIELPSNATFINGTATVTWKAKWFVDRDGAGPNPELNFNASINPSIISNDSLIIYQEPLSGFTAPTVNLIKPQDMAILPPGNLEFKCEISDLANINNVSLYTNVSSTFKKENFVNPHEYVADNSTIALYHFNNDLFYQESSTKFVDFSRYSNNGSCSGIPTGCPSRANSIFSSAAVDYAQAGPPGDSIQVLDKPELGNMDNLSVSAWVYPRSGGDGGVASIINKPNAFVLRMDAAGSGRSNFRVYNTLSQSVNIYSISGSVPYNTWTHIVGVYNSTNLKIYINGVVDSASAQLTGKVRDSTDDLYIGNSNLGSATFDGLIDEIILFNKTLSDSEIQDLYQRKNPILNYGLNKTINNITSGLYIWNCLAYSGESAWGINNYSFLVDASSPIILWEYPTPENNSVIIDNKVYLNTTVIDETNTSALFDWNGSLAGYWSMDYYNGTGIYDNSSYNNFGKFMQSITSSNITAGVYGKALDIGNIGYVLVGNKSSTTNITDELTVMGWIYSRTSNPYQYLVSNDRDICCGYNGYSLRIANSKLTFRLSLSNGLHQLESTSSVPLNSWHHIAGTFNGTSINIYIDGNLEGVESFSKSTLNTPGSFELVLGALGFAPISRTFQLNGSIDEVTIISRALSTQEIKASYSDSEYRLQNDFKYLVDGQYNYSAYAIDSVGNLNISKRIVFINRIPIVNLSKPEDGTIISQPSIPLELQCNATSPNYLENITLYSNISGVWNLTKSIVINELSMDDDPSFLVHFNGNNVSDENEVPLSELGTNFVVGKHKQAINVNVGDNLYYNSSNNFNISYGTIEFWIKPNWNGNDMLHHQFFFSRADSNGDHIKIGKTYNGIKNYIYATFNTSAYEGNSYNSEPLVENWQTGDWHHVAVTYNLSNHSIYLYLDGVVAGFANDTTCSPPLCLWDALPTKTGSNFSVGHNYILGNPTYADSAFDELIIYDKVLNITEIRRDMVRSDPTLSYNATFKVANISSGGPYKWTCLVYDVYNRSSWANENWTFTYTSIPYITLLSPANNSNRNAGLINFSCLAEDYDKVVNVTLEVYNKYSSTTLKRSINVGEIENTENALQLLMHLNNDSFFNENSTFVADASGNNNNGFVSDASFTYNGRINGGYLFDSFSDFISVNGSNSLNITGDKVTIEAWFNATQFRAGIIAGENIGQCLTPHFAYNLETRLTGAMGFQIATDTGRLGLFATNTYLPNEWIHIAGVYNGTYMKLYINGILNNTISKTGTLNVLGGKFFIGKNQECGDYDFNGVIDEVAVYNRDLSDNEIMEHFNMSKRRYTANYVENLEGGLYEWNCQAYDSNGHPNYAFNNNTLDVNSKPNLTSIFLGNDGSMYNCKDGCYITPYRHSNVSNLSIRVSLEDTACSLTTHKVFMHLCLINSTASNENCNEATSNYTFYLNNLSTKVIQMGGSSNAISYLCNFSTASEIGPEGQDERGTPAFYISPGEYKIFVNTTEIGTSLNASLSSNYSWIYRTLIDTGFINNLGAEVDTIQIGDGDIQLGEYNPGINEYKLQNWGNLILNVNWNASNPMQSVNQQVWNINEPPDGFLLDDDSNVAYPDVGLMALNITNISEPFVFANGLRRCTSYNCNDLISGIYPVNESLSTRWHIKPLFGLSAGQYNNEIMYIISPWKSSAPSQFILDNQASVDTSISALDNRTFVAGWVNGLDQKISFIIYDTNGTNLTGIIDVDQTVDKESRVSVSARNSSHFVIAWYDGLEQDVTYSIYNRMGQINYGPIDLETVAGASNSDISLTQMNDRFHVCYVDVEESDADDRIVTYSNLGIGTESSVDLSMSPELALQNLIGCTTLNNSRIAYTWFDDFEDDASYAGVTQIGTFSILPTDIDLDVWEFSQVAVTSFNATSPNYSRFALSWFDSAIGEIKISVKDYYNNNILSSYLVGYSAFTRLAMTSVRNRDTKDEDFILAWYDGLADDIKAATFDENGTIKYGPFVLADDEDSSNLLFDIYGRSSSGDMGICDGSFIFAYTNITGQTLAKAFKSNGGGWDGNC